MDYRNGLLKSFLAEVPFVLGSQIDSPVDFFLELDFAFGNMLLEDLDPFGVGEPHERLGDQPLEIGPEIFLTTFPGLEVFDVVREVVKAILN